MYIVMEYMYSQKYQKLFVVIFIELMFEANTVLIQPYVMQSTQTGQKLVT